MNKIVKIVIPVVVALFGCWAINMITNWNVPERVEWLIATVLAVGASTLLNGRKETK